jgi:hypothetical protein
MITAMPGVLPADEIRSGYVQVQPWVPPDTQKVSSSRASRSLRHLNCFARMRATVLQPADSSHGAVPIGFVLIPTAAPIYGILAVGESGLG